MSVIAVVVAVVVAAIAAAPVIAISAPAVCVGTPEHTTPAVGVTTSEHAVLRRAELRGIPDCRHLRAHAHVMRCHAYSCIPAFDVL